MPTEAEKAAIKRYHRKTYKLYSLHFRKDFDSDLIAANRNSTQVVQIYTEHEK